MSQDNKIILFPIGRSSSSSVLTSYKSTARRERENQVTQDAARPRKQHVAKTKDKEDYNLSFCGCGFLGIYHVGVASCFHEYAPQLSKHKISGSSAGALVAVAHICGNLQLACCITDILRVAIDARARNLGPLHPSFDINALVREALEKGLPDDVHKITSGKLHISLTRVADGENVVISQFDSKEEVIQTLLCSCFIPFWSGLSLPKFRGVAYMDGGFSNNLLVLDSKTVTVSPFAGETDICPQDDTHNLLQISLSNTSFSLSPNNLYRLSHALMPPPPEALSNLCEQGFADAIRYLQRLKLISCTKCLEIRSSLLASSEKGAVCGRDQGASRRSQRDANLMVIDRRDDTVEFSDNRESSDASQRLIAATKGSSRRRPVLNSDVTMPQQANRDRYDVLGRHADKHPSDQDNDEPSIDEDDEGTSVGHPDNELDEANSATNNRINTQGMLASTNKNKNKNNNNTKVVSNQETNTPSASYHTKPNKKPSSSLKKLTRLRKFSGLKLFSKSPSDTKRRRDSIDDEHNAGRMNSVDDYIETPIEQVTEVSIMKKKRLAINEGHNELKLGDQTLVEAHYRHASVRSSEYQPIKRDACSVSSTRVARKLTAHNLQANMNISDPSNNTKISDNNNNDNLAAATTTISISHSSTDADVDSTSDYEDSCDECFQKIQNALRRPTLPEHFSDRIRDACENVNKSLSNWLYSHRPIKYLSYLATPYLLPIDISLALVYRCWKRLPEISTELLSCIYQLVNMLIGIVRCSQGRSLTELLMCQPMITGATVQSEEIHLKLGGKLELDVSTTSEYNLKATIDWESEAMELERKLYWKECQRKQRFPSESLGSGGDSKPLKRASSSN